MIILSYFVHRLSTLCKDIVLRLFHIEQLTTLCALGDGTGDYWMAFHAPSPSLSTGGCRRVTPDVRIVWLKVNWCVSSVYLNLWRDLRYRHPNCSTQPSLLHASLVSWTLGVTCVKVVGKEWNTWQWSAKSETLQWSAKSETHYSGRRRVKHIAVVGEEWNTLQWSAKCETHCSGRRRVKHIAWTWQNVLRGQQSSSLIKHYADLPLKMF